MGPNGKNILTKSKIVTLALFALIIFYGSLTKAQTMKTYPLSAKGTFEVDMKPEGQNKTENITFGKYSIQKTFKGGLEGISAADMLSVGSDNGSAAYVAIERVVGTLNGRKGTFVFTHSGTMTSSSQQLTVSVVPGCGTGELLGLEGKLTINIVGKEHFYSFEYSL